MRIGVFVLAAVFALAAAGAARAPAAGSDGLERLVGARLVVGMQGTTPTPALLEASVAAASAA